MAANAGVVRVLVTIVWVCAYSSPTDLHAYVGTVPCGTGVGLVCLQNSVQLSYVTHVCLQSLPGCMLNVPAPPRTITELRLLCQKMHGKSLKQLPAIGPPQQNQRLQ